ncbi:MAG: glycosyltransferase [Candidatus Kapaibacteriales bacterium]
MNFWGFAFLVSIFLILYPIVFYPLILFIISCFWGRSTKSDINFKPKISIVASFYNEEKNISDLFESIINSGYPLENVEILFGSDGSDDQTDTILREISTKFTFVKTYFFERQGKTFVINKLVKETTAPFILLIDADVRFTKGSIDSLVSYLSEPEVGIVSPNFISENQKLISSKTKFNINLVGLNNLIRKFESSIYSTVNLLGACYIIRRELLPEIPSTRFCDDFFIVLNSNFQGKRVVLANNSFVILNQKISPLKSFYRQRRFVAGSIPAMLFFKRLFFKNYLITFFLFSGKVLRWLIPINIIFSWFCLLNIYLKGVAEISLLLLFIFALIILVDYFIEMKGGKIPKGVWFPSKIFFSLTGTLFGLFRSFTDRNNSLW